MIATLRGEGLDLVADGEGVRVRPATTGALARAVEVLRARRIPVRVRGGGDRLGTPASGEAVLDLEQLGRIATVDARTGIARVEAGCRVDALEAAARGASATLGPLLPSVRAGSVGAWLAGPTRGERGIPGGRRETAALAVSVVLPDGRIAESRAAPRSATGPDLDHLALGGEGRLFIVAAAVIRLFPKALSCRAAFRVRSLPDALEAVARLCRDRLEPAEGIARADGDGAILALCWEGASSARLHRDRALRRFEREGWTPVAEIERAGPATAAVEVDASWESLVRLARDVEVRAIGLVGLHAGGAYGIVDCGAERLDATEIRGPGLRILAPSSMRDAGPAWDAMGAAGPFQRLVSAWERA